MAQDHSFDVVSQVEVQEVRNALAQAMKEVRQRFDFKGSKADISYDEKGGVLELRAEDDMKLNNLGEVLRTKLVKRSVPLKAFDFAKAELVGGGMLSQKIHIQNGIPVEKAREIVKLVKGTKRKVQAAIQADQVRISGKNKDDLQVIIELLRDRDLGIHMQFVNYR